MLNQVRVREAEANPVNAEKKQTIVATLLRNLGAVFAGRADADCRLQPRSTVRCRSARSATSSSRATRVGSPGSKTWPTSPSARTPWPA